MISCYYSITLQLYFSTCHGCSRGRCCLHGNLPAAKFLSYLAPGQYCAQISFTLPPSLPWLFKCTYNPLVMIPLWYLWTCLFFFFFSSWSTLCIQCIVFALSLSTLADYKDGQAWKLGLFTSCLRTIAPEYFNSNMDRCFIERTS